MGSEEGRRSETGRRGKEGEQRRGGRKGSRRNSTLQSRKTPSHPPLGSARHGQKASHGPATPLRRHPALPCGRHRRLRRARPRRCQLPPCAGRRNQARPCLSRRIRRRCHPGGYYGGGGGYAHGGVEVPAVACQEKGPCYGKKVACPKRCFWSYSRSGNGYGAGGGGGSCTVDCRAKCTATC
ncbi:uncharacterized protein LOC120701165 [Panicum virgatum]|uniref:uncharacterized protein LOC120701165 n=1 Tax=Panicum virgatum TaxID=38727 RepID=UPI0019D66115|nr:uncharacterized protein LOC120701165 [Panicum virgatum]